MAAFKEEFSKRNLTLLAGSLKKAYPAFSQDAFLADCFRDLEKLELKGRVDLIARSMKAHLPSDYTQAVSVLMRAAQVGEGMEGFQVWPHTHFVLLFGCDPKHFEASMDALEFFTKRFTAEFAIRPFLKNDPKRTLARMKKWAKSDNKHLRRLASEGLRPLLPWGEKLADFIKDPSPGLAILELLKHDPEEYVRKSVANHMNDFSKHHPELVVSTLLRWNKEAPHEHSKNVAWIVRHASRTLLKKGHLGAMRLQGLGKAQVKCSSLRLSSKVVTVGKKLEVDFSLISQSKVTQKLMIDYAVYHQKANGRQQPKVFKYKVNSLKAGEKLECTLRHSFKPITTRRYYAGEHAIEILVNGLDVAKTNFQLKLSR